MDNHAQRQAVKHLAAAPSANRLEMLDAALRSPVTMATAFLQLCQLDTAEASGLVYRFLSEQGLAEVEANRLLKTVTQSFFARFLPKVLARYDEMPFSMLAIYNECVNTAILADFEAWRARQSKPLITIAHIDDEHMTRFLYRLIMNMQGDMISMGVAADTEAGGPMVERLQPDLVILDHMLPGRSGIEALDYIHGLVPHSKLIFHSYRAGDQGLEQEALAHGAAYVMPYTVVRIDEIPNIFRRVMGQPEIAVPSSSIAAG